MFCGAGGSSTGLVEACEALGLRLKLVAINHWPVAIDTHSANHPQVTHYCQSVESLNPREVVPGGRVDLLIASPECIHHSRARGGRPKNDQSRASAWHVLRWAEVLDVKNILLENVTEFLTWGPLDSKGFPIKSRKGETFDAFIAAMKSLNYNVEWRVLNCANYGDPTTRERLFIIARKGRRKVAWPKETHARSPKKGSGLKRWVPVREVIDWAMEGESIFTRKRPLSPNTLRRIVSGLRKFSGLSFVLPNEGVHGGNAPRSMDDPLNTVTASRGAGALVEPFVLNIRGGGDGYLRGAPVSQPSQAVTGTSPLALVQASLVVLRGTKNGALERSSRSVDDPAPTVTSGNHIYLAQPHLMQYHGGEGGEKRNYSTEAPIPAVDTSNRYALCQPFVTPVLSEVEGTVNHGRLDDRHYPVDETMRTVTSVDAWALIEAFLVNFNGNGTAHAAGEPIKTVTGNDRFGLVMPVLDSDGVAGIPVLLADVAPGLLDIRFRMLQPRELAGAMSFPSTYVFTGTRKNKVKQIGNAVPRLMARALCHTILS